MKKRLKSESNWISFFPMSYFYRLIYIEKVSEPLSIMPESEKRETFENCK